MRLLSFLALCTLTACMPSPQAEVTKSYPNIDATGSTVVVIESFSAAPGLVTQRSNAEMAQDFLDLEFRMESGRALPVLTRFNGPITLAMAGAVPVTAPADLVRLISRFRDEAGLDVQIAAPGTAANITINFESRAQLQNLVPSAACFVVPGVRTLAEYKANRGTALVDWALLNERRVASVFVPADTSPQEVRDCLHEELAQAMGPLNDLYRLPDSVFNDDNFHTVLTGFDMLALRVHYAPELHNGMNEADVASRVRAIYARLNPAGERAGAAPGRIDPRAWIDAVAGALGPRGAPASRMQSATRMLSIAKAQGWRDNRLGFSYFALGRLELARDPQAAVAAFTEALRIYSTLPDGGLHAAHVNMQLAAIALASGQSEQAITFADKAIPVVARAENAALLATLMMIKSQALGNLGHTAEAQALSLDSVGWARYGFGAEYQVRAHSAEIAALAARGNRG